VGTEVNTPTAAAAPPAPALWPVLELDHPAALQTDLVGAKAANLARTRQTGLPVLPGFALTTATSASLLRTGALDPAVREAWAVLAGDGRRTLVVRSSSTIEDGTVSSMAGLFTSVLDVQGWDAFVAAVHDVADSGRVVPIDTGHRGATPGIGVLVQPQLDVLTGGVLFGADPVTGRRDRLVVSASTAGPAAVVSGEVVGDLHTLNRRGRVLESTGEPLPDGVARSLARLAARTAELFGGPQDIEWAVDTGGNLWLLQARPVTAVAGAVEGPVLGPGPVAETLPDALSPLETDLWVPPLRAAIRHALAITGSASSRRLSSSPVVTTVAGRAVADLELLGIEGGGGRLRRLDPRPPARRLRAAWNVGRVRAALPSLARETLVEADAKLAEVPAVDALTAAELVGVLRRSGDVLTALHGQEILMGMLSEAGTLPSGAVTAAGRALHLLAAAREAGLADDEIVRRHPAVLALVPPTIGGDPSAAFGQYDGLDRGQLAESSGGHGADADDPAILREALRLRARWVQELTARAAWELGARLHRSGVLPAAGAVRLLQLDELEAIVAAGSGATAPADLEERRPTPARNATSLPAAFRVRTDGSVVAVERKARRRATGSAGAAGTPAGGGRGEGVVSHGPGMPPEGAVLVVTTLDPGLAAALPRLSGLVAETGSPLSHLAILARELGVPTVVGVPDARARYAEGTVLVVDGTTGEVVVTADVGDASGMGGAA
jgi:pyruvate,water dikinase